VRVAVIGAGHNGLVNACYLAMRGFDVTVYESRDRPGGMADTEVIRGVKVSRASYVLGLMPERIMRELDLHLELLPQDPFQVIHHEGRVIPFWRDRERRIKELRSAGEDNYQEFEDRVMAFRRLFLQKLAFRTSPPSIEEVKEEAQKKGLEEFLTKSSERFLREYISEDLRDFFVYPHLKEEPAFMVAYYFTPEWSVVKGGMGSVGVELERRAKALGVKFKYNTKVEEISVKEDRVKGIRVKGRVEAYDVVVSALSPLSTVRMLGDRVKAEFKVFKAGWRKYNVIMREVPELAQELRPFRSSIIDYDSGEMIIPSFSDQSLGGHVVSLMGDPDEAPVRNLREGAEEVDVVTPDFVEKVYGAPLGILDHIPMKMPHLFDGRPVKGWGYRSPVKGLYLTGAGTYPGGQVTGIPGRNAAMAIIEDLERGRLMEIQ